MVDLVAWWGSCSNAIGARSKANWTQGATIVAMAAILGHLAVLQAARRTAPL